MRFDIPLETATADNSYAEIFKSWGSFAELFAEAVQIRVVTYCDSPEFILHLFEDLENLSADRLYAQQDRLVQFALGSTDDGITDRGRAWASADVRSCIDSAGVVKQSDATALLTFTVNESCTNATMSLVSYTKPTAGFSPETASQQELFEATTETFGLGTHTITVGLPEATTNETAETESVAPL